MRENYNNHICRGSDCRATILSVKGTIMSRKRMSKPLEDTEDTFGKVLKRNMLEQNIDVKELSVKTGISVPSLYRYLSGERICGLEHTAAICISMRLDPMTSDYLFSMTRSRLCRTDERDRIIAKYLYACYYDSRYTLAKCNHELAFERYEPLTNIGMYRSTAND